MYQLFLKCVDYIFPPREATLRVRALSPENVARCYAHTRVETIHVITAYTDQNIRALIHEAKFHGNTYACTLLHTLVLMYLEQENQQVDMIIPIPLSRARMRARGYNQVYEILRAGNIPITIPIEQNVLTRIRDTRPQTELPRSERLINTHDAFGVVHGETITGKHILLIDDVMTTGTTLKTAKATLQKYNPASITCLALAH